MKTKIKKLIIIFLSLIMMSPFLYMFYTSFKVSYSAYHFDYDIMNLSFDNYIEILSKKSFFRYFLNSTFISFSGATIAVLLSSLAAYSFAKLKFKGRIKIFNFLVLSLIIPSQVLMVPLFLFMIKLSWVNTFQALILPIPTAFGILFLRQAIVKIPNEIFEAARLDGASEFKIYRTIVIPMLKENLTALFIFTFVGAWNEFLWPLLISGRADELRTLSVALASLNTQYTVNYGVVMAGATLSFLPPMIIYLILQKKFLSSINSYQIKG